MEKTLKLATYVVRKAWLTLAVLLLTLAVLVTVARYSLPLVENNKATLQDYIAERYGVNVQIGHISAEWQRAGPVLVLNNLNLEQNNASPVAISLERLYVEVDFWQTLLNAKLSSNDFSLQGLTINLDVTKLSGSNNNEFPIIDALKSLFLEQLGAFSLNQGSVTLQFDESEQRFELDRLAWLNEGDRHQGQGTVTMPGVTSNSAFFIVDLVGDIDNLDGTFYASADDLDLAPLIGQWIPSKRALTDSRANFEVWAEVADNRLDGIFIELDNSMLEWGGDSKQRLYSGIEGGSLQLLPHADGWHIRVEKLIFNALRKSLVFDLVGSASADFDRVTVNTVRPVSINPLLMLLPLVTEDSVINYLDNMNPDGELATLQFQLDGGQVALAAKLLDVNWGQYNGAPGISGLDIDFSWFDKQGVVALSAIDSMLLSDQFFAKNEPIESFIATTYIYPETAHEQIGYVIHIPDAQWRSEGLALNHSIAFRTADKSLSLLSTLADRKIEGISDYFPSNIMGKDTAKYLTRALTGQGQVTNTRVLFNGPLDAFPFDNNEGIFQVLTDVSGASFSFAPDWPQLTELNAQLDFLNAGMDIRAQSAKLRQVDVANVTATIDRLTPNATLLIDGFAKGQASAVADVMNNSSLRNSLGYVLSESVVIDGEVKTDLNLSIPLTGKNVVASGVAYLSGNDVMLENVKLPLTDVTAAVNYRNEKITVEGLAAKLFTQPIKVDVMGAQNGSEYTVDIGVTGNWLVQPLIEQFRPAFNDYLAGYSNWFTDITLRIPKSGFSYDATLVADLSQANSLLPAPFAFEEGSDRRIVVMSSGDQQASQVRAEMGKHVRFEGELPHNTLSFEQAHLALGKTDYSIVHDGFTVAANLPEANFSDWYKTVSMLIGHTPDVGDSDNGGNLDDVGNATHPSLFPAPSRIVVETDHLSIANQQLNDVNVIAKQAQNTWELALNANQARADITLFSDWQNKGVRVNADYLSLSSASLTNQSEGAQASGNASEESVTHSWDMKNIPPLYVHCQRCQIGEYDLGAVTIDMAKDEQRMQIRQLKATTAHGEFSAQGYWDINGDSMNTQLSGQLRSKDFGRLLQDYQFESGIKDSGMDIDFDLNWNDSPIDFSLSELNGQMKWKMSDGYLTELSDRGSRLFTLFSFESLVRKLSLDFRDVFAKGFFYDSMRGSLNLERGIARTDDTVIDGGAGEIVINGFSDLNQQTLNYDVSFAPNVTGNLPFLVFFLANPPSALAALAIDQVLTEAKVISNINYRVTGTFDEPVFSEINRKSKDVTLPAQNQADPVAPPQEEKQNGE